MAPEQAVDTRHADERADIYSLGCTLFYLLTGRKMYDGDTLVKKILAHREDAIPSLCDARDDVPRSLDAVFHCMVAKNPLQRYQSMDEVIEELHEAFDGADEDLGDTSVFSLSDVDESNLASFLRGMATGNVPEADDKTSLEETQGNQAEEAREQHQPKKSEPPRPELAPRAQALKATQRQQRKVWYMLMGGSAVSVGLLVLLVVWLASGRQDPTDPDKGKSSLTAKKRNRMGDDGPLLPIKNLPPVQGLTWSPWDNPDALPGGLIPRPTKLPGVKRWQAYTDAPNSTVWSVQWHPTKPWVACGCDDGVIRVFNVDTSRLVLLLPGHTETVASVAWSPDGTQLASGGGLDHTIRIWNVATKIQTRVIGAKDLGSRVLSVAWSPDGRRLAAGCAGVAIWDAQSGRRLCPFAKGQNTNIVAWSPDGTKIATNGAATGNFHI